MKKLKPFLPLFSLLTVIGLWLANCGRSRSANLPQVMISQVVAHPAIEATTRGIIDELAAAGYTDGKTVSIKIQSAQANAALAGQIASNFASAIPAAVIGIGTVPAQACAPYAASGRIKLLFSSVTDPLGAQLVNSLEQPSGNVSGVSNFVPLEPQLELFKKIVPGLKRLGIIYNPGEANSASILQKLETLCPSLGITLLAQAAPKTADVAQSATRLAQSVDAIFISNDNTALSAMQSIVSVANAAKIPVFVSDTDAVNLGALAALGPNQYEVGRQTGRMAVGLLKGGSVGSMPVQFPEKTEFVVNPAAAERLNIQLPSEILEQATLLREEAP